MTRTQWGVVIGLLAFILVIFGVLLFQLRVPKAQPTSPPPAFLLEEEAKARHVLPIAQQAAQNWRADAYLSSAEIVWDDLGPGGLLKRDRWTFQFYSPSKQQLATIRVVNGAAQQLRTGLTPKRLPELPLDQWQIASTQAFESWWQHGGGSFVKRHKHVSISLKLRTTPDIPHPIWNVVGTANGQHQIVQINGTNGSILN